MEEKKLRQMLDGLLDFIIVAPVDVQVLKECLVSHHADFEDAIQIFCAKAAGSVDHIITRDKKGFTKSPISVLSPDEFFLLPGA